ncbi:sensor histidine kinase [Micromonospora sp. RTGN7]|uniref:sensor histidine kinase n=1 Tax=Micromonospora sp. RTGN7 TaxID=3016526 RepID=UPI0029FEE8AC|nr:sensor histidine kinase [Micromonospora sp. RTGN7]
MCRWSRPTVLLLVDAGLALLLLAVALPVAAVGQSGGGLAAAWGLAAVQASCLLWMRRWPVAGLAVATIAGLGLEVLCPQLGWLGLVAAPLAYLARLRPPRVSLAALGLLAAGTPWKLVDGSGRDLLLALAGLVAAWALGEVQRGHAERRDALLRQVAVAERARISRELHDVVAHHVAVIAVQAAAAEDVLELRPDQARAALGSIQDAARSALTELRAMLQTLSAYDDGAEPNRPQPGLAQLDTLVEAVRAAGVQVTVDRDGPDGALPDGVELSAYRIVQESLTNVLRHGRARRVDVTVRHDDGELWVEVVDDGPGPYRRSTTGLGRGVVGMRERARLLGGTVEAGPLPAGGFRVRARLPVREVR